MKYIIPIAILTIAITAAVVVKKNPPEQARKKPSNAPQMVVDTLRIQPQEYQVILQSFGTVKTHTQTELVSQVSGQIIKISDAFNEGGFFQKGDVLVTLDDRDYRADLNIAKATLSQANQALIEERAESDIAYKDWQQYQSLPNQQKPSDLQKPTALSLRTPQLEAAKAAVLSAQAQVLKAELALERTRITAPYDGRVLSKNADIGQFVSVNTALASVFATDYAEIRLPINNKDLALIDLPEDNQNSVAQTNANLPDVNFTSAIYTNVNWQGLLMRTEGAIDSVSQQLNVIAQINQPFSQLENNKRPLKVGQYLNAQIKGNLLSRAMVIPNSAIYQSTYVYLVEEGLLKRTPIEIFWQNDTDAIIASGLKFDDVLVTTPLGQATSGLPVETTEQSQKNKAERRGKFKNKKPKKPSGDNK